MPAVSSRSLCATGRPCSTPGVARRAIASSALAALAIACSATSVTMALTRGIHALHLREMRGHHLAGRHLLAAQPIGELDGRHLAQLRHARRYRLRGRGGAGSDRVQSRAHGAKAEHRVEVSAADGRAPRGAGGRRRLTSIVRHECSLALKIRRVRRRNILAQKAEPGRQHPDDGVRDRVQPDRAADDGADRPRSGASTARC